MLPMSALDNLACGRDLECRSSLFIFNVNVCTGVVCLHFFLKRKELRA
jgi:hypothetical protein